MLATPRDLDSLPWITKDGYLDMGKVPLESVYRRVCEDDPEAVRSALGVLAAAAGHGRNEAAVFLLGFFVALPPVRTPACASLLLAELDRVKSGNSTRRYLDRILEVLAFFPAELVSDKLAALARDRRFRLRACGSEADRHSGRRAGMPTAA